MAPLAIGFTHVIAQNVWKFPVNIYVLSACAECRTTARVPHFGCVWMNSLRLGTGIQYMPPKKSNKKKSKPKAKVDPNVANLTRMMAKLNKPQSEVTDLGRLLLKGGNMLSGLAGFPKIFGSGAYSMEQNTLWNISQQVPSIHSQSESVIFRHREYVLDISMNGATFNPVTFAINPGVVATFPYLSYIANAFQEYSFKGLIFEFKTTSATSLVTGTNTAMGSVMLAVQYRADAAPFSSKTLLLNEMWSVDTVPSQNAILPVECAPKENPFQVQYVRSTAPTGDIKMYDLGTLTIATAGGQTGQTNVVGELWVSYEVELRKPQVSTLLSGLTFFHATITAYTTVSPFNTITVDRDTIGMGFSNSSFSFPTVGIYAVYLEWTGATTSTGTLSINVVGGALLATTRTNATNSVSIEYAYAIVGITSVGGTVSVSSTALPNTGTTGRVIITPVPPGQSYSFW